jgi:hypothetical protein
MPDAGVIFSDLALAHGGEAIFKVILWNNPA